MSKNKTNYSPLVYSTDPNFKLDDNIGEDQETLLPAAQKIKVRTDKKHRAGKIVTLIENFIGTTADKEELGKKLKAACGTGGSVKDGEILVQGDNSAKVMQWLIKNGFTQSKKI
jgi:translation initiation factor 1